MPSILVVEDAPQVASFIERVLCAAGYEVTLALSGEAALASAQTTAFDVAIVDYRIPPPDGLQVLTRLREQQPQCVRILMSGGLNVDVTLGAVNRGEVARVLQKPCDAQMIRDAVEQSLTARMRAGELYVAAQNRNLTQELGYLKECIHGESLQLALQPIVEAQHRRVVAHEALLRSSHPVLNTPVSLLDAAERHQLISEISSLVAIHAAGWLKRLAPPGQLFINLHPNDLGSPERLQEVLAPVIPFADRVVLEVTERSSVLDLSALESSIALLSTLGFALAVDDLGAGYSSLSVLAELKPQFLKVDMSIVRGIDQDRHKQRLFELLCRFGQATATQVIAEGIETPEEASVACSCGAHRLQGYLFGKPTTHPAHSGRDTGDLQLESPLRRWQD